MYHCLNKKELFDFLVYLLYGVQVPNNYLSIFIDSSEKWEACLGAINYCFSMIIDANKNLSAEMIETLYSEIDKRFLEIHELDLPLIDHMIKTMPSSSLSIEENLIDLQTDVYNYNYDKQIRY